LREYQIYQLRDTNENADIRFMNYDYLLNHNRQVDFSNYRHVYQGEMKPDMNLESIYTMFNIDRPDDFYGHSLSVSDIVVVRENGAEKAYYVDSIGFKEIPIDAAQKQRADAELSEKYVPLYRHTYEYARQAGQIDECRLSRIENMHCAQAIDKAIAGSFDGMRLDTACVRPLIDRFGTERISWVLANTLLMKDYDGRFSGSNKEWGAKMEVPLEKDHFGSVRNAEFVLRSHPAVLDMFIVYVRRELDAIRQQEKASEPKRTAKEERPSVRSALRANQARVNSRKPEPDKGIPAKNRNVLE